MHRESMPGRNDPCSCGSGRKFKKCCGDPRKPQITVPRPGKLSFVGLTPLVAHPQQTFDELAIQHLVSCLDDRWIRTERKKPDSERHYIIQCLDAWRRAASVGNPRLTKHGEHSYSLPVTGILLDLLTLAFDLYRLADSLSLFRPILARLQRRETYQGARYEIAVASIAVRCGYRLSFPEEAGTGAGKKPEFLARHPQTQALLAIEAKARHRPGVLHRAGEPSPPAPTTGTEIRSLVLEALDQIPPGMPSAIFVDRNSPPVDLAPVGEDDPLYLELRTIPDRLGHDRSLGDPYNLLVFTNMAYHYVGAARPIDGHGRVYSVIPLKPRVQYPDRLLKVMVTATLGHGLSPERTARP